MTLDALHFPDREPGADDDDVQPAIAPAELELAEIEQAQTAALRAARIAAADAGAPDLGSSGLDGGKDPTQPVASAFARSTSVEALLATTGIAALTPTSSPAEKETALESLRTVAVGQPPVRQALLRNQAVQVLDAAGIASSAKLVDAALSHLRTAATTTPGPGSTLLFSPLEPWPQPVDGVDLLTEIETTLNMYAVLPKGAATAVTLWIVHTYCIEAADITPRLAIISPTKRCGKTTVLKLLGMLVSKPLTAANLTPAVLYRTVEAFAPTVLVDEADTFLRDSHELRGVLNSGHDRGTATVPRCVGDDFEPRVFNTFGAVAIAAIGRLPDTLMDRSIAIEMKRKAPGEQVRKLRRRQREALAELPRRCARWAVDNMQALAEREPSIPEDLDDRAADNWEPLLAIAEQAGGPWSARARATALLLSGGRTDATEIADAGVQLLGDVRAILCANKADKLTTKELLSKLVELEGRPWAEWSHGRALTPRQIGGLLDPYGVKPRKIRLGELTAQGYNCADFNDAFGRYLAPPSGTSGTEQEPLEKSANFDPEPSPSCSGSNLSKFANHIGNVPDVPDRNADPGPDDVDSDEYSGAELPGEALT